jgi:uncharacterized protein YuzE
MAIQDRQISELQEKLAREYGSEILLLNPADLLYISVTGHVTGSDALNGETWVNYRSDTGFEAGEQFRVNHYLELVTKLGIIGRKGVVDFAKRKSRDLKTATGIGAASKHIQYRELFKGGALFTAPNTLRGTTTSLSGSSEYIVYNDLPASVKTELDSKMIEASYIEHIKKPTGTSTGDITYIAVREGRELVTRSIQAQGLKINRQNLRAKSNARGTRGRFNSINNNQEQHYATGSWKTNGGGPRIQGPTGGGDSCTFVIIHKSGSLG